MRKHVWTLNAHSAHSELSLRGPITPPHARTRVDLRVPLAAPLTRALAWCSVADAVGPTGQVRLLPRIARPGKQKLRNYRPWRVGYLRPIPWDLWIRGEDSLVPT
jgi:hypothetical protein